MNTKTSLLVLMDSGHFKAYRMEESPRFRTPRLRLLEEWHTALAERISDQVSDKCGQFAKGSLGFAAINDMADGERHNLELELRRRALKQMAARMSELLETEPVEGCYFAAEAGINRRVLMTVGGAVQKKIQKHLRLNLTRLKPSGIVKHFRRAS